MARNILLSASAALQTLRANPLHSILSTLGIVIGVAALVAILALADGMEDFGRDQVARTTDFQSITISPRETDRVDDILVRRPNVVFLSLEDARSLRELLKEKAAVALVDLTGRRVRIPGDSAGTGAFVYATEPSVLGVADGLLAHGRMLSEDDLLRKRRVAVLTDSLARKLSRDPVSLLGTSADIGGMEYEIVGLVTQSGAVRPAAFVPLIADSSSGKAPIVAVRARAVEDVPAIRSTIEHWLDGRFTDGKDAFQIATNEFRVDQVRRGILVFKVVMGIITGISVIVGGIGIMNVLLVSITERTREIGVRRSTGARRRDIVTQFLAESTALSFTGCFLGTLLGFGGIFALVPAIRSATDVPFQAAFDWSTVAIICAVALLVGLIFGTYPAYRASRLSPIDALRHE